MEWNWNFGCLLLSTFSALFLRFPPRLSSSAFAAIAVSFRRTDQPLSSCARGDCWRCSKTKVKAYQSQAGRRLAAGPPFQGQGRARPPASSPCFAFNRGELCRSDTCRYTHKCRFCGGAHPVVRCFKAQAHGKSPRTTFPPSGPSGGTSTATVDSPHGTDGKLPSPVSLVALQQLLHGYDPNILHYLLHGFGSGFLVGCIGLSPQVNTAAVTNLKSASEFPEVIDLKLSKELRLGRVLGPFAVPPLVIIGCHPLVSSRRKLLVNFEWSIIYPTMKDRLLMISFPTSFLLSIMQLFPRPLTLLSIPLIWFTWLRSTLNQLFGSFLFHQQTVHSWDSSAGASFSWTPCCLWGVPVLARFSNVSVLLWVGLLKLS